ncbi:SDR family NAD(P)-dependent oxidoreductase [Pseudooceanicola sp. CBS1P-1]|uniref:SDR family NAD(P)-dependent oxidoreductase n=1 Tax=Pseudooceanicola albus TaxID=2692189 RepID=A0A6L7GAI1_9RHOB|nr:MULTISPECIES: type I polyketide synthase [Pseudooceanicola]MBT9386515.1 SDR family NAD(P)-dependent oxidoreductase [Pseudooceanicola endophyticus]MXN20548.1 SDR family NAD(P)-dependent oxidoreductase [Pseudooceanicola albus]
MIRFAGRACRLPMAPSVAAFADLIYGGRCAVTEIPDSRWRKALYHHPVPGTQGKTYSFAAGVLEDPEVFDPAVFGISPREALSMDPQQRLMLQVVWEALEDACLKPSELAGKDIGVFAGASMTDYAVVLGHDPRTADGYVMSGNSLAVIANRVSHVFDWHGPSMTIDTACSSSLFALKAAQQALLSGEVEIAVVGATNMLMLPSQFVGFAAARMLSPSGLCQAFSAAADGYVRAEGAVAFVLTREDAALASPQDHGRLIHVGTNTSGATVNIALPSAEAQLRLLRDTYRDAGIDPEDLAFVEAHGTGTAAGDPIEAGALGEALGRLRRRPLPIGSVKTNIGHLEPAAGCAGLLKAQLALESGRLAPSLHSGVLNPAIPFEALNVSVPQKVLDLPAAARLAGVSSFGFGGANAHAIIAAPAPRPVPVQGPDAPTGLYVASAFCRAALAETLERAQPVLEGAEAPRLKTEALHLRDLHPERLAILAEGGAEAVAAAVAGTAHPAVLRATSRLRDAPTLFLFSGNGAQFPGMSLAALDSDAAYRAAHDAIDAAWQAAQGWSLQEALRAPDLETRLPQAPLSQPLLFADQVAMARALMARGATPGAVLGHSAGEVAAAHVAGLIALDQALRLVAARSTVQHALEGQGTMAALQVPVEEAEAILADWGDPQIGIAADNSPRSVSLVGPPEALEAFRRHARKTLRLACVPIRVRYPYHSALQEPLRDRLLETLGPVQVPDEAPDGAPAFYSTVSGRRMTGGDLDAGHWWANMRQPVQFRSALQQAARDGFRVFQEIGPDPVLAAYARDSLQGGPGAVAVLHSAAQADATVPGPVARAAARLYLHGGRIPATAFGPRPAGPARLLGAYPWQGQPYRAGDTARLNRGMGRDAAWHPLLGIETSAGGHVWQGEADQHLCRAYRDHRVGGRILLPGMALAEMALAAGQRALKTDHPVLADFDMRSTLPLGERDLRRLRTELDVAEGRLRILSRSRFSEEDWQLHATGALSEEGPGSQAGAPAPDPAPGPGDRPGWVIYRQAAEIGLDYGPAFARVARWRQQGAVTEVLLRPVDPEEAPDPRLLLDVVGTDAVLHGLVGRLQKGRFADAGLAFVPVRIDRLELLRPGARIASGRVVLRREGRRSLLCDVMLYDAGGQGCARLSGLRLRALRLAAPVDLQHHAFGMALEPLTRIAAGLPDPETLAAALADSLPEADEQARLLDAIALQISDPAPDLPPVPALLADLLTEAPSLGAEVAALALRAEDPDAAPTLPGGAFEALRDDWLLARVEGLHAALPDGQRARLLEVGSGPARLLPRLAGRNGAASELWACDPRETGRRPPLALGEIGQIGLPGPEDAGRFDLVVISGAGLASAPVLEALRPALAPGGVLLLVEPRARPFTTLLNPGLADSAEDLAERARAAGLAEAATFAAPEALGGVLGLVARQPVPEAPSGAEDPLDPLAAALGGAGPGPDPELTGADLQLLPRTPEAPLILLAPPPDPAGAEGAADACLVARLLALSGLLQELAAATGGALWLICPRGACHDGAVPVPQQAALWAALRSAKNEYPALELHAVDPGPELPTGEAAQELARLIRAGTPETEIVLTGGRACGVRVRPGLAEAPVPAAAALRLEADPAGGIDQLDWYAAPRPDPGPGEVRLRVEAAGLNYRDVMWSMGVLPEEALETGFAGPALGLECAGRIEACGPGVTGLHPGDRVVAFGSACLSSHLVTAADCTAPLPEEIPAEQAATLPVACFTALYALDHLAGLAEGETVLIHGGAGGVGLAALQLARARGARVIATAGTPAKRALLRALGAEIVLSSRDGGFEAGIRARCGGVDVVLNALSGEGLRRSLGLLRPGGRFLELGKVDFYAGSRLGMRALKDNIAFHGIDIDSLLRQRPALARRLFGQVMQGLTEGWFWPLPLHRVPAGATREAFRAMQRSAHLGKLVITPPDPARRAPARQRPIYHPDPGGLSIIAGGGRGLGLALADRLVRDGASAVALLGRSTAPPAEARDLIARAAGLGAEVRYLCCDITCRETLEQTLAELRLWRPPELVVNSAMLLQDMRMADLTGPVLERALAAKLAGTRNLDRATRGDALRDFVVFTSMATLIGNHGQSAYVAANAAAEALIRARRAAGLPGLAVGWGAIEDTGYLSREAGTAALIRRFGGGVSFTSRQALRALDQIMGRGPGALSDPVAWISPMSWSGPVAGLRLLSGPTFATLAARAGEGAALQEGEGLRLQIQSLPEAAAVKRLTGFLLAEIARILRVPEGTLSAAMPVSEMGVDSLMGVELGLAAQQALGDDIPLMAISGQLPAEEIARRITRHLQGGGADPASALTLLAAQHGGNRSGDGWGRNDGSMEAAE